MSKPPEPTPLLHAGLTVQAEVLRTSGDTCFLRLRAADGSSAHGRLMQNDSLQVGHPHTLDKLPAYATGKTLQVMLKHKRRDGGQVVWFTHERWAHHNPWEALKDGESLLDGDRVTGVVIGVVHRADDTLVGYFVQLDTREPICDALGAPWAQTLGDGRQGDLLQPDLEVFLPSGELPETSVRGIPLALEVGERVAALVINAQRQLPEHPLVSVRRLREVANAHFWNEPLPQPATALQAAFDKNSKRFAPLKAVLAPAASELESVAPWEGRRIALVDDQALAAEALAATLKHRGADVLQWLPADPKKGWHEAELHSSLCEALASDAELLLVDDGMPQPHRGEDAVVKALIAAREAGQAVRPRVWLMSGQTPDTARAPKDLLAYGVQGSLRRPLAPNLLQTLLDQPGHTAWHWHSQDRPDLDVVSLNTPRPLDQLLRFAKRALEQDYAVLLAVGPGGRLRWLASAGRVPFESAQLGEVLAETDLGLLAHGKQAQLVLGRGSTVNLVHPQSGHVGRWQALGSGPTPEYLLGVGSQRGRDCGASWPWLVYAARAELRAQHWSGLFQANTAALSAGWLAEGYAHESVHDRQDLLAVVEAMERLCGQAQAQGSGIAPERLRSLVQNLQRVAMAQEAKAQTLLQRQRQRSAPLHLRAWLANVQPLLARQCGEAACALRVGDDVPDLVLPVPEWLLGLCVVNLVLNAAKHNTDPDVAWVRLDFALQQAEPGQQNLHIQVQDNGWGLTPDARAQLFSPGVSEAPTPEARHGIGLWLSQTLVREAGGALRLAWTHRGFGACFELVLPVTLG
jgi:hypothetical protein